MTITRWLTSAVNELADNMFESPLLDAELILAHTIGRPRTWLHAHADDKLDSRHIEIANSRIDLRLDRVPIAYIIGHKEFYGRQFFVTPNVLIPRPESEQLITILKNLYSNLSSTQRGLSTRLVDIGTGSGCLGITAKLELPDLSVDLIDTSRSALKVAERNSQQLNATVSMLLSDLLTDYPYTPDIILANLPYVDTSWQQSPELSHEPKIALFADKNGLAIIERCLNQASHRLLNGGLIILEADTRQLDTIADMAIKQAFSEVARDNFMIAFTKD